MQRLFQLTDEIRDGFGPDLDESIHVSEAHEKLLREAAAAAREKHIPAAAMGPLPMGLVVVVGVILVIAGGVLYVRHGDVLMAFDISAG